MSMKIAACRRKPEIRMYFPVWHHHHSGKMRVLKFSKQNHLLVIEGSAARLRIIRFGRAPSTDWCVDWYVVQSQSEKTEGRVIMTSDELKAAFGLTDKSGECGDWLIERYGADSAEQGKYIRWDRFLNIPCPGTGHDGDPNISVEIDEEMRNAVQQLLG